MKGPYYGEHLCTNNLIGQCPTYLGDEEKPAHGVISVVGHESLPRKDASNNIRHSPNLPQH
jgi:hypothetical protein